MLSHAAGRREHEASGPARATLEQTLALATRRVRMFLNGPAPASVAALLKRSRYVYDAQHTHDLRRKLVMSEHKRRSKDVAVMEAYDGAGVTHDFLSQVYGRNSIDGRGMRIDQTVHYGNRFDNAMWNGRQMIYGDGDGILFNRFTIALDVIGHELTHGVTQTTARLGYEDQTGALNEHISDAFGSMVKQWVLGQSAKDADWLIGAGLFTARVIGRAVRSLAEPGSGYDDPILGRDPQPAHMRDYVFTDDDNGGVHINSGIPNHAFYLAAIRLGGRTWEVLGRIWFEVLTKRLGPAADFDDFARITIEVAGEMYGNGGRVQQIVRDAWAEVGLGTPVIDVTPAGSFPLTHSSLM
jgi:Zn-dependent metalloprotease